MRQDGTQHTEQTPAADLEFDQYVSYADGDATVVCDRRNPSAWIRSTDVRPCRR